MEDSQVHQVLVDLGKHSSHSSSSLWGLPLLTNPKGHIYVGLGLCILLIFCSLWQTSSTDSVTTKMLRNTFHKDTKKVAWEVPSIRVSSINNHQLLPYCLGEPFSTCARITSRGNPTSASLSCISREGWATRPSLGIQLLWTQPPLFLANFGSSLSNVGEWDFHFCTFIMRKMNNSWKGITCWPFVWITHLSESWVLLSCGQHLRQGPKFMARLFMEACWISSGFPEN